MFPSVLGRSVVTLAGCAALASTPVAAAPRLTSAEATVRYASSTACDVALTVAVADASDVEHRLELLDGASVTLAGVDGATQTGATRDIGRTRALTVAPASPGAPYTLRYQVQQTPSRPGRCPIWLPTAPAGGSRRGVRVTVQVPDGRVASGTMPTFTWQGASGSAVVPHLPAFVIVPFGPAGASRPWDVSRVMDLAALTSIAAASALWARRKQGGH